MLHTFKLSLLLVVSMCGVNVYSAPTLLFFLAEKNTVRIESYQLDQLQPVNFISNKLSNEHTLHVVKMGTKNVSVNELLWDANHPDQLAIVLHGKNKQSLSTLQWYSLLITNADCLKNITYVPGMLCEIEEQDSSYSQEYRSQILLQMEERQEALAFVFERPITTGCVLLVADGAIKTHHAKKALSKNDVEALGILSVLEQKDVQSDEQQPQPHITIELEEAPPAVVEVQANVQEEPQAVIVVPQEPVEQYHNYAQADHPVAVTVTNPVFEMPWHKQWYAFMQLKLAAMLKYVQRLFNR
ncbi:hypothetical protein Noda2021_10890 [Candidatus Dependentiae bacterium Noda2021]|nr:hypothetical protein Noda2021_10890 [Candidatus Dependentiae bacterium Noda2021]